MNQLFLEDDELKLDFFGEKKKGEPIFDQELNDVVAPMTTEEAFSNDTKKDATKKLYNNFINSDQDSKANHDDTRNINFLLDKFKEENGGIGTNDICVLFSFW